MNVEEIQRRLDEITRELRGLVEMETRTADQESRVDELIEQANEAGRDLAKAKNVRSLLAADQASRRSAGRASGIVPPAAAGGQGEGENRGAGDAGENREDRDTRSLARRFYESDEMEELRSNGGNGVAAISVESFFRRNAGLVYTGNESPEELRALVNVAGLPASYLQPQRVEGIQRPSDPFGSLRDVIPVGQTNADSLVFFRENVFTNNAAPVAEATATTGASGLKPESGITFTQATSNVATIAHWIPITRQTLWNAPEFESYIEGRLIDGLRLEEDTQLLSGDGVGTNMTGLLNTSGIQVLDAAYFAGAPVSDPTTNNELFNRLLRARTLVSTVGRARANFVVLNPTDHEVLLSTTDGQRQYFGGGPFNAGGVTTVWGMRVVENENITAGTALVGDGRFAMIWDRMAAQVLTGTINDQFTRNMVTLLAEERVGLTVFRPSAFAEVELAVTPVGP